MANHEESNQELEQKIKTKNLALLNTDKGVYDLMVYNHENFSYRYLETSCDKDLKCESDGQKYWTQSIEPDVFTALKWNHKKLKPVLIDLCKQYPGKKSAKIQVKLELSTEFKSDSEIVCSSRISWDFPEFQDRSKEISLSENYQFSDLLELRNHHAAILERVSSLF